MGKTKGIIRKILSLTVSVLLSSLILCSCGNGDQQQKDIPKEDKIAEQAVDDAVAQETASSNENLEFLPENLAALYESRKTVTTPSDFLGTWNRTAVHSSHEASIEISAPDEEGFEFTGEFYYFSHSGEVSGKAYFVSADEAVFKQFDEGDIDGEPAYIGFKLNEAALYVITDGFVEGLGMNVTVDGDYIDEEPFYTNANIIDETFTQDDLDIMKELLGEDSYRDLFIADTETGGVTTSLVRLTDDSIARYISCVVPTMVGSMGYEMLISEDGHYYFLHETDIFVTNDTDYEDWKLPDYTALEDEEADADMSPFILWEYVGYLDECEGYIWREEFMNCDYDGDSLYDRVNRSWDQQKETAVYTIEFGNGDRLVTPIGWETGFPHVQSGDLDADGVKEILVTLSYDTSTDPLSFGDMWLFDKDSSGKYNEAELPLAKGENGAKCLTINYEEPDGCVIRYSIREAGLTRSEDMGDDYVNYWWTEDATTQLRSVYWAEIIEGTTPAVRCYVAPLPRGGESMGFNLSYRNGKYEIGYMELDSPDEFG